MMPLQLSPSLWCNTPKTKSHSACRTRLGVAVATKLLLGGVISCFLFHRGSWFRFRRQKRRVRSSKLWLGVGRIRWRADRSHNPTALSMRIVRSDSDLSWEFREKNEKSKSIRRLSGHVLAALHPPPCASHITSETVRGSGSLTRNNATSAAAGRAGRYRSSILYVDGVKHVDP